MIDDNFYKPAFSDLKEIVMTRWNKDTPEPLWVSAFDDVQIVEAFKTVVDGTFIHEQVGRKIRDMRKRLLKILIDGLEAQQKARETWE